MRTLLLSAHLDDAVLSAGRFLSGQPDCDVLTVFAGVPKTDGLTLYDDKCGFTSSGDAVLARQLEDRDALALLKANPIYWEYLDSQYLPAGPREDFIDIVDAVVAIAADYDMILAPLGLLHEDHIALADAVVNASEQLDVPIYLWEDLPARVVDPIAASKRLNRLQAEGLHIELEYPGIIGPLDVKIRSLLCYRSQLGTGDLDFNNLLVPERFWKIKKDGDAEA